ncbi:hypothetical protein ACFSX6_12870 [Hymenobacter rubripertinctus]
MINRNVCGCNTTAAKMAIMREFGIQVVDSPAEIGETMLRVLGAK